ncbi:GNAT family N-acetyltransferase [Clostridium aminobutyricum]|uniref:GNAT family N-acetyltransferase n=1 Tax=Clostridium aminobutyricum TaxID=33953 RepID=A0A939DBZ2_CLOAM|nr:GNAT family N-acetyltransferase [Clostridium aminobutyricum]MBN7774488.1 GNAT family N-acetyltransferase [Clostridium aminobutyricum]
MITYREHITVEEYSRLREAVGWHKLDEKQAERSLQHSFYLIAAYEENRAIASARVISDSGYMALIADVMVAPDYQRKGIGTEMLERIMKHLESSISEEEILMINLMSVPGREKFYSKFGFVERPNETMGAGMVKWLHV